MPVDYDAVSGNGERLCCSGGTTRILQMIIRDNNQTLERLNRNFKCLSVFIDTCILCVNVIVLVTKYSRYLAFQVTAFDLNSTQACS